MAIPAKLKTKFVLGSWIKNVQTFFEKINEIIDYLTDNPIPSNQPLVYKALISQSATDAPVVTVVENTLGGAIVWARSGMGVYLGTLAGAFTANKTLFYSASLTDETSVKLTYTSRVSANVVRIATINTAGDPGDNSLDGGVILIEVYP